MYKLVVYDTNKTLIDQRFFLTEPTYEMTLFYSREMTKAYGLEIVIQLESVKYAELGELQ